VRVSAHGEALRTTDELAMNGCVKLSNEIFYYCVRLFVVI